MRLGRLVLLLGLCTSAAWALGPSSTDWRSSAADVYGAGDAMAVCPVAENLNAVAGRGRPNLPGGGSSEVWAVGDNGTILYFNGASWVSQASGVTAHLRAVYIYQADITAGGKLVAGWACGDGGTLLKLTHPAGYVWEIANNPAGACAPGQGGPMHICSDMLAIFPADRDAASTHLFITGQAMCGCGGGPAGPDEPAAQCPPFGANPLLLDLNMTSTIWAEVKTGSAPYTVNTTTWPAAWRCDIGIAYTGLISDASGPAVTPATSGFVLDSSWYRQHLNLVTTTWGPPGGAQTQCTPGTGNPAYYAAAKIGRFTMTFGDTDPQVAPCSNASTYAAPVVKIPGNVFVFDQNAAPDLYILRTGIDTTATNYGTIRSVDWLQVWGFGIGVGAGDAGGADYTAVNGGLATDAYFALIKAPDSQKVFYQDDPTSPNEIIYRQKPSDPSVTWPNLNGVFLSNYNEGWAVGDVDGGTGNGAILHWVGPAVTAAKLVTSLTSSPSGSLAPNSTVDVIMTVTNTGGAGVVNFAAAMPTPAQVTYVSGPICSTIFACPTTLAPGGSANFTWTFSTGTCTTGITFLGTATGKDVLTTLALSSTCSLGTPAGNVRISSTLLQAPAVPVAGGNVTYLLVVANTGTASIPNLTVVDTVPPPLTSLSVYTPPGFAPPLSATVAGGGTRITWTSTAAGLDLGTTLSFTITGSIPTVCPLTVVTNRFRAIGLDVCLSQSSTYSQQAQFTLPGQAPVGLQGTLTVAPVAPTPGSLVTYTLTASNTGGSILTDLAVWDTIPAQLSAASLQYTGFAPTSSKAVAGGTLLTWTFTGINMVPGASTAFTVSGTVYSACQTLPVPNEFFARALNFCGAVSASGTVSNQSSFTLPGAMDVSLAVSSQVQQVPGRSLLDLVLTVSDTGVGCLSPLTPVPMLTALKSSTGGPVGPELVLQYGPPGALTCSTYQVTPLPGPCTPDPCVQMFTWRYLDTADYAVTFIGTVSATICTAASCASCVCGDPTGGQVVCTASATVTWFSDSGEPGLMTLDHNLFRPHGLNQKLVVSFNVKENGDVSLAVYNSIGQRVRTLFKRTAVRRQQYDISWDGTNDQGERVSSGAYFVRLESTRYVITKKVALIK